MYDCANDMVFRRLGGYCCIVRTLRVGARVEEDFDGEGRTVVWYMTLGCMGETCCIYPSRARNGRA